MITLKTNLGDIVIELDEAKAPISSANFKQYAADGHYDGTVFHRVIDNFMIQGGGFTAQLKQKATRAPIALEASNGLRNDRGTIGSAQPRTELAPDVCRLSTQIAQDNEHHHEDRQR